MHPELLSDMQDGLLRVRITNACNAKCRYCGVRVYYNEEEKKQSIDKNWLFELLKPIYSKVKLVLITGGDPLIMPHSYDYIKFLSEEYPQITPMIESNGILFDHRIQNLAMKNLIKVHISINASNRRIFANSCWDGSGGEKIYDIVQNNLCNYISLLKKNNKVFFAPDYSMVVNHDNFPDVLNFAKLALKLQASSIGYLFDYTENDMGGDYFSDPQFSRPALKTMMELERVLADKVMVTFRLWLPVKELDMMQKIVDSESDEELYEKYAEILKLAEGRSIIEEFKKRNNLREKEGKKLLTFKEDFTPTIHMESRQGKERCFAPWGELDIYPDGKLDFCGWYQHTININDFIKDGVLDWNEVINSYEYMYERKAILNGDYIKCLPCCPMNDSKNPVVDIFKYSMTNKME